MFDLSIGTHKHTLKVQICNKYVAKQGKIPTRQNVLDCVSVAWDSIDPEIITSAFLRCGISNAVDGSEDDLIREEIPKEIEQPIIDEEDDNDIDPFAE